MSDFKIYKISSIGIVKFEGHLLQFGGPPELLASATLTATVKEKRDAGQWAADAVHHLGRFYRSQ